MKVFIAILILLSVKANAQDLAVSNTKVQPECMQTIKGLVKDRVTNDVLPNTIVSIQDEKGNPIYSQMVQKDGQFVFELTCNTNYRLKAMKKSYTLESKDFKTSQTGGIELKTEIFLDKGSIDFITASKAVEVSQIEDAKKTDNQITKADLKPLENSLSSISQKETQEFIEVEEKEEPKNEGEIKETTALAETIEKPKNSFSTTKNIDQKEVLVLEPIIFDYESSYLNSQAKKELQKVVTIMKENPNIILECASYTDAKGSEKYNQWMSDRRAKRTVDYIVSKGISSSRITGKGYGESKLLIPCEDDCTDQERAINRRTEFILINQ